MHGNKRLMILVINPGSTSTKIAIYQNEVAICERTSHHTFEELKSLSKDGLIEMLYDLVQAFIIEAEIPLEKISAIAARGGVVGNLDCGAYLIDKAYVEATYNSPAPHPANNAAIVAYRIAQKIGINAYVYDAVCGCGNPEEVFTLTGLPDIKKEFYTHVLNSRAVSIQQAQSDGKEICDATYIVAHLGGGITVNLVHKGRILDFVGDDEGAFSPERAGGLPCRSLVKLCYSGKYSEDQLQKKMKGGGGLQGYLGTNDLRVVEEMIEKGDEKALTCVMAMAMQVGKDIGSLSTVVSGKVDGILLTGGLANSKRFTDLIVEATSFIAPIHILPGTFEMKALASGILRVIRGVEEVNIFSK